MGELLVSGRRVGRLRRKNRCHVVGARAKDRGVGSVADILHEGVRELHVGELGSFRGKPRGK
jgi:hypothetical protein